jgi:ectoine hydroxylase-related dioxygenase (phytanoyl-CoA dioxygenase family)
MARITDRDYEQFEREGYIIVEHLLTEEEVDRARSEIYSYMPSWDEYAAAPTKFEPLFRGGSSGWSILRRFPFTGTTLNDVCVHDELVTFARKVMQTSDIVLEHASMGGKYAGKGDFEQSLHCDYGNHVLTYPQDPALDPRFYDVACLVYHTDVTIDMGPTYIVSQLHTAGQSLVPRVRSRADHPSMYEHEMPVTVPAGSALVYSLRTFHRGSAMLAKEGARFHQHLGWRAAPQPWYDLRTYMESGGSASMDRFLVRATPEQRSMVGFPPPGDPYWNDETLDGVQRRYPEMDMTPYKAG